MQWNQFQTNAVPSTLSEFISIKGNNGDSINAYYSHPTGPGPHPGIVLIHHLPGWDEVYAEFTRRFAFHGFAAISPDLYSRVGSGTPDDVAAKARAVISGAVNGFFFFGRGIGGGEMLGFFWFRPTNDRSSGSMAVA